MNRKEGIIVGSLLLATFITGVFAVPEQQLLNVFVTNFPEKSHLGQDINDHVTLVCIVDFETAELFCQRVFPDGTRTPVTFTIPVGSVLAVTDLTWRIDSAIDPGGLEPGSTVCVQGVQGTLEPDDNGPSFTGVPVFHSCSVVGNGQFPSAVGSEHMTAGLVMSSVDTFRVFGSCSLPQCSIVYLLLYGYLKTMP